VSVAKIVFLTLICMCVIFEFLLCTLTISVGIGRTLSRSVCLCVCLFVHSITQKRMIPKCSNLVKGMTLGYPASGMVLD